VQEYGANRVLWKKHGFDGAAFHGVPTRFLVAEARGCCNWQRQLPSLIPWDTRGKTRVQNIGLRL